MAPVLRPGGGVVVGDTDDGTLVLDPPPPGYAEALEARHETFRRRGADPLLGRRLPGCFRAAGVSGVRVRPLPIDSVSIGAAAFAKMLLAPLVDAIDEELMSETQVDAVARAVEQWSRLPEAFGLTTAFIVGGRRP